MFMNLSSSASFSVPGGYPVRLLTAGDMSVSGIIGTNVSTVTAVVQTESGTANAHMALYTMPTTSGGTDNAQVSGTQVDASVQSSVTSSLVVTVPTGVTPACYVVRLWVDSITGANVETVSRDGSTAASSLPKIPVAVMVNSVTVA